MSVRFECVALYEEVWTTPLTKLAARYGLSDVGLRKVCKAMDIPLPGVGHWAKAAVGKADPRPPLPAKTGRTEFVSEPPPAKAADPETEADAAWLAERIAFEADPANRIEVPFPVPPRAWHPLLTPARDQLHKAARDVLRARRAYADYEERKRKRITWRTSVVAGPNLEAINWYRYQRSAWLVELPKGSLPLRFTPETLERGLALVNAVFRAAEARGFSLEMSQYWHRLQLKGHGGEVGFRAAERTEEAWRSRVDSYTGKKTGDEKYRQATGELRLYVTRNYSETRFGDDDSAGALEGRLNEIFVRIWKMVVRCRADAREAERREQARQEAARVAAIRAEEARQEQQRAAEAAQQVKDEEARRAALVAEARRWRDAAVLREYIAHVAEKARHESSEEMRAWLAWASIAADELDPTKDRLAQEGGHTIERGFFWRT